MKDLIDERNRKEKMQSSILKWWNVHYMTPEELEEEQEKEEDPSVSGTKNQSDPADPQQGGQEDAQEIMERLEQMARAQEEKKQREIEEAVLKTEENYNPLTGSYSGSYGSGGADSEHEDQIAAILTEKEDALRDLIEHADESE